MIISGRCIAAIALALAVGVVASAQNYSIRVTYNTNIRAEPSLSGARLETAQAGSVLEVTGSQGRWLHVNRHGGAWMASWVSHERVEAPPTATTSATAPVDNCCGIDRACHSDQQWTDGYWAYQRGECQAPATTAPASSPASQPAAPATISTPSDNCCGIDRQCHSDQDWVNGYWAYQQGQCGGQSPPTAASASHGRVRIFDLTAGFADLVNRGFELLRARVPHWYAFAVNGLNSVHELHETDYTGYVVVEDAAAYYHHAPHYIRPIIPQDDHTMAEFLVHEACHVYQYREGRLNDWLANQVECVEKELQAALEMGGESWNIPGRRAYIANPTYPPHYFG